jgi:hypothetical protein
MPPLDVNVTAAAGALMLPPSWKPELSTKVKFDPVPL